MSYDESAYICSNEIWDTENGKSVCLSSSPCRQMKDAEYVDFLQAHLPRLQLRWAGYRKVRKQVIKRIKRRIKELDLRDPQAYFMYLEQSPEEWSVVDRFCRISISRFYRDRGVFDTLGASVFPMLIDLACSSGEEELRGWSIGCASGEEVYTLKILYTLLIQPEYPGINLSLLGTDVDTHLLSRAQEGFYEKGSLKELPSAWTSIAFEQMDERYKLRDTYRQGIRFIEQDIREELPEQSFHLVLCRNLVFTYFAEGLQSLILGRIAERLCAGGFLVIGKHERLPEKHPELIAHKFSEGIYRKRGAR